MRFALDANVLLYAFDMSDKPKHDTAVRVMNSAALLDCVVPAQVLGEFLNVIRRKRREYFAEARAQVDRWTAILTIADTSASHIRDAAEFADRHKLQFWDSVIWQVAYSARVRLLLSEDLQDGLEINGLRVMNPFNPENLPELLALLSSAEDEIDWEGQ